jgi:hypothetical protein
MSKVLAKLFGREFVMLQNNEMVTVLQVGNGQLVYTSG